MICTDLEVCNDGPYAFDQAMPIGRLDMDARQHAPRGVIDHTGNYRRACALHGNRRQLSTGNASSAKPGALAIVLLDKGGSVPARYTARERGDC